MITLERIQDQRFICLGNLGLCESLLVSQVHVDRYGSSLESWQFRVHFHVDCFGGLDAEDELITCDIGKYPLDDVFVLDANLDFGFVQGYVLHVGNEAVNMMGGGSGLTFARLHYERHTFPSWIVDPQGHRCKRRAVGVFGHSVVVVVSWLVASGGVLTQ